MEDKIRLNIGSGHNPLHYWVNIDSDPAAFADKYISVPPLPYGDGEVDEIYAGHFLEHLTPEEADEFLLECRRVLKPGGKLGIVVPDTREVVKRYLDTTIRGVVEYPKGHKHDVHDLDEVCRLFFYSTVQNSPHRWSYDRRTLSRRIECAGFRVTGDINNWSDPRIPVGGWYQFGLDAVKV